MWRIAVVALCAWPTVARAQAPITLETAVAQAVAHNALLRAARAGADEARAAADRVHSAWFPTITVNESWQRGNQPVFVFSSLLAARQFAAANFAIDALNHPDPVGFFQTTVGVEQTLLDWGRRSAQVTAAAAGAESATAEIAESTGRITVETTDTFARLLAAQAAQRTARSALEAAREDHARAARRRDVGMATDADVLALAVHVADLNQREIQSRGDAASAEAELNRLMGTPVDAHVQAMEPPSASPNVEEGQDVPALLAEAEKSRPELTRARSAERAAEARQRQARATFIPDVAAQAAVNLSGTSIADRSSAWIVGGEFRWRFSTGGAETAALRASTAALTRARAELEDARAAVQVDVVKAVHQLETARARRDASAAAVEQALESQRIIRDRFEAGIAQVNDVLRASSAVLDADANRVAALVDGVVAAAALRRALGRTR